MKKLFIIILVFIFTLNTTNAWFGLVAETGDLLNTSKWNEMINLLNKKIEQSNVTGTGNIEVQNSGTGVVISFSGSVVGDVVPYISNDIVIPMSVDSSKTITINGYNFTPNSTLQIPGFDGTINSITPLSPVKLEANITSGSSENDYDIVISNGGLLNTQWSGNGTNLLHVGDILGTGVAGTYLEDFEAGQGSWVSSGLTGDWTRDSGGTPSGSTGPETGAGGSTWYMYTEVSSGANSNEFGIETSDFRHATSISLDYHMYGSDIGTLYIQTLFEGTWTTVWSISGQQQANQTDAYINTGDIDLTGYQVEKIRILMNGATGYMGDTAVDNISITSD